MSAQLLTVPEVADRLHVSVASVRRLLRAGALESVLVLGSRRIPEECLDAYIEGLRTGGAA